MIRFILLLVISVSLWGQSQEYRRLWNDPELVARVDAIGMQCHLLGDALSRLLKGEQFRPLDMMRNLDRYADFHLPIHVTEVTIPTPPNSAGGEATQAEVTRNLHRPLFSHLSVEAITWWNLADGTAFGDENKYRAGLVRRDMSPKPSYEALRKLIREEWHTRMEIDSGASMATTRL